MFVRFRPQANRLQASLVETRRVGGRIVAEHIGALGSVDAAVSVRERLAFWAKLPERLARLANRVGADNLPKIYEALHARIPMVTPDEQRAIQEENAKDDERFWDALRDMSAGSIEGRKALIAKAEAQNAEQAPMVEQAAEKAEAAKSRLEKIRRGEAVAGGLGKRLDVLATLKAAGFTTREMKRMQLTGSLTDEEFETVLARTKASEVIDKVFAREVRRLVRKRS
jgi:hypothetical protein